MRVLDLFSGVGGFSLGLEAAGMRTVAFCEVDPFCRAVLAQHWPGVPIYDDVRTLTATALRRDGVAVDLICGGFPCQDVSFAGKRAGLEGARSGLWGEYRRLVGEIRPRFVIVENVPGLLSLGMGTVLGDLSALGYDAVWDCIPASAVGAPHRRDRVWIVAADAGSEQHEGARTTQQRARAAGLPEAIADPASVLWSALERNEPNGVDARGGGMADANGISRNEGRTGDAAQGAGRRDAHRGRCSKIIRDPDRSGLAVGEGVEGNTREEFAPTLGAGWWLVEPDVGRVADGVPARVDRLRALGNAVVPQIAALIGRAIMDAMAN